MLLRRSRAAAGLLLAAAGVALCAALLLAGLTVYGGAVVAAATGSTVASADPADRSILVRGSAGDPAVLTGWDASIRGTFAGGLAGRPARVASAEYGSGWALARRTGTAVPDTSGVTYASVMRLDDLAAHADLLSGAWPAPGSTPVQASLAEPVATVLGVATGDRLPLLDRRTGRITELAVSGVWRPRAGSEPYWRLAPEARTGTTPQSATYGPVVLDRADFTGGFSAGSSAAWLVEPDLAGATTADVARVAAAATAAGTGLPPEPQRLDRSAAADTGLPRLAARLARAELVGRSALVTPILLVSVLSAYTLLLVALLLADHRRGETALLRARGAARGQLAGLAVREALLVVLPAAALAAPAAAGLVSLAARLPGITGITGLHPRLDASAWLTALAAAAGCALAVAGPAFRRGRTYAGDLAELSRPSTRPVILRLGLDLALVAVAVLGWLQLRRYASPVAGSAGGTLGIDPLLAAAPTLGVVAGAVLGLRLLGPAAWLAGRLADRLTDSAAAFGAWQAGRRSHAGPMVLVALAVSAGTVSWCLAGTSQRSGADQADQLAGADLRVEEVGGSAPAGRAAQLAALPGVRSVLPAWRYGVAPEQSGGAVDLVALDASAAGPVVPVRDDLTPGGPRRMWRELAAGRGPEAAATLPAGATRLTGVLRTASSITGAGTRTTALFAEPGGGYRRVPVEAGPDGRFAVAVPAGLRPAGFLVTVPAQDLPAYTLDWSIGELDPPLPVAGPWQAADRARVAPAAAGADGVSVRFPVPESTGTEFSVGPAGATTPVPVFADPAALDRLRSAVGRTTVLTVAGAPVEVRFAGTVGAVPGTTGGGALLADLPTLSRALLERRGVAPAPQEWRLTLSDPASGATAAAATGLVGVRVVDRRALAVAAARDPFGAGARIAVFGAALGALLLAAAGIAADVRATVRRRTAELAVLNTLGAGPRLLARSLVVEQALLAGLGAVVGLFSGVVVAVAMAPLLVLTPAAERPVPAPLPEVAWTRVTGTAVLLVLIALGLSALAGLTMRRRLAAARLRIGQDR